MGCDIHFAVEINDGEKWHWLKPAKPEKREYLTDYYWNVDEPAYMYHGRNYWLFSILAGVRGSLPAIDQPRGRPKDISPELNEAAEEGFVLGEHSESHLTLTELDAYDWCQTYEEETAVDYKGFLLYEKTGRIENHVYSSQALSRVDFMGRLKEAEMEGIDPEKYMNDYAMKVTYPYMYKDMCKGFYYTTLPALHNLAYYSLSKLDRQTTLEERRDAVRIVFGFDS